jgi:hypothetical protein
VRNGFSGHVRAESFAELIRDAARVLNV